MFQRDARDVQNTSAAGVALIPGSDWGHAQGVENTRLLSVATVALPQNM